MNTFAVLIGCFVGIVLNNVAGFLLHASGCTPRPSRDHGSLHCKNVNTCTLTCEKGYKPHNIRVTTTHCHSGKWSALTECLQKHCPDPPKIMNGKYHCRHNFQRPHAICDLHCDPGFKPDSKLLHIQCSESETWTASANCVEIICTDPPKVPNGAYHCNRHRHKEGDICRLQCNDGYRVSSANTVTCLSNSRWSTGGSCAEKHCPDPPKIMNGKYYCRHNFQVQRPHDICDLHCDPGFKPDSKLLHIQCSESKTWTASAKCVEIICTDPPKVPNGAYHCNRHRHKEGDICRLQCNDDYRVSSANTVTCLSNSRWSTGGSCAEVTCADPPKVTNGDYHCDRDTHKEGDRCSLRCNDGYKVSLHKNIICRSTRTWSIPGFCAEIQCPDLPKVMNGKYFCRHNSKVHRQNEICDLHCDPGFKPDSKVVHTECSSSETWTASAKCVERKCRRPPDVQNGRYSCGNTSLYIIGSLCELHCDKGFRPNSANDHIRCEISETWSKSESCVEVTCPDPPQVTNGTYHCDRTTHNEGDICSLNCNDGYRVTLANTITCLSNSRWSTVGSCEDKQCPSLPTITNGRFVCPHKSSYKPHDICDLSCNLGYKPNSPVTHTECLSTETWSPSATCKEILCQEPPSVSNGRYSCVNKTTHRMYDTCDLLCDAGYTPDSNVHHTRCLVSGTWSPSALCEAILDTASLTKPGQLTTTTKTKKASSSTTWTRTSPVGVSLQSTLSSSQAVETTTLSDKQCPSPPTTSNGKFFCLKNSTYKPHDICDLICEDGFIPTSQITHTVCLPEGKWTESASCKEILCQEPPPVSNGKYSCVNKTTHRMYDTCDLLCDAGYTRDSNIQHILCLESGIWSPSALCEAVPMSTSPKALTTPLRLLTTSTTARTTSAAPSTTRKVTNSRTSSSLSTQQEQSTTPTIVEPVGCEVCSGPLCGIIAKKDPLVTCPTDMPYCMNHMDNKSDGRKTVTKKCASSVECNTKWWRETSDKSDCVDFNPKNVYSYSLTCYYCCTEDGCNRAMVPARKTLFLGHD